MSLKSIENQEWNVIINWFGFSKLVIVANREGVAMDEALARSIAAYSILSEQAAAGATIVVRYPDGTETEVTGIGRKSSDTTPAEAG